MATCFPRCGWLDTSSSPALLGQQSWPCPSLDQGVVQAVTVAWDDLARQALTLQGRVQGTHVLIVATRIVFTGHPCFLHQLLFVKAKLGSNKLAVGRHCSCDCRLGGNLMANTKAAGRKAPLEQPYFHPPAPEAEQLERVDLLQARQEQQELFCIGGIVLGCSIGA